jgi:hypothetical protein
MMKRPHNRKPLLDAVNTDIFDDDETTGIVCVVRG